MKKKIVGMLVVTLLITVAVIPNVLGLGKTFIEETDQKKNIINDASAQIVLEKTCENPSSLLVYAEVHTDKFIYHKGQTVYYTLLNKGSTWISIGGPPMGEILKFYFIGFNWDRVYPKMWHLMLRWIAAGSSITEEWDQQDIDGNPVPCGIYRVDAWYFESSPPSISSIVTSQQTASDYFIILP